MREGSWFEGGILSDVEGEGKYSLNDVLIASLKSRRRFLYVLLRNHKEVGL